MLRCNRYHQLTKGTTAYDSACECAGLIERVYREVFVPGQIIDIKA